jgi:2-dehydro-3-deoxyphosphooctonate aldolase (KDO 8-P synthase)
MKLCGFDVGLDKPFFLIAGPCVIESEQMALDTAGELKAITGELGIPFIYKSSFDKANRSSGKSFRGLGMEKGLEILATVKRQIGVPVLTDVHEIDEIKPVAAVVDVLQTPAFLCRQTDFIRACAQSGKPVNIKKGQFLAPHDMKNVIDKARDAAREAGLPDDVFMACERGVSFGYNNLVSDMRSLAIMRETGAPWCSMPPTRCSCRAARAPARAASANSCRCSRVPRWLQAWRVCSWRPTPIRARRCRTAPTPCRCRA